MKRDRTPARVRANRLNALKSTGPKTAEGKLRSSRNARRHGLAADIRKDPALLQLIEKIAGAVLEERSDADRDVALTFAESHVRLSLIQSHPLSSLASVTSAAPEEAAVFLSRALQDLALVGVYEAKARASARRAGVKLAGSVLGQEAQRSAAAIET